MPDGTTPIVPEVPTEAVTPGGINHLVINVRDIEESHKFWTEMLGFKQVGYSKRRNGKMRFYSGYELPREVWGDNIQGAIDYAEPVATEGDAAFDDDTDYPHFGTAQK